MNAHWLPLLRIQTTSLISGCPNLRSQTTSVFSCAWHTNVDAVTSKLHPSWNQLRFHRERCSNYPVPAITSIGAGKSCQPYCTAIVQSHPVFFSNIWHSAGTKAGTDRTLWQIKLCFKLCMSGKTAIALSSYCNFILHSYFFTSVSCNNRAFCHALQYTTKWNVWTYKQLAGETNSTDRTARVQHSSRNTLYPSVHLDAD